MPALFVSVLIDDCIVRTEHESFDATT